MEIIRRIVYYIQQPKTVVLEPKYNMHICCHVKNEQYFLSVEDSIVNILYVFQKVQNVNG